MKLKRSHIVGMSIAGVVCVLLVVVAVIGPKSPDGRYDSSIVGHGSHDSRLIFQNGSVILTGGDGPSDKMGSYTLNESSGWIWRATGGTVWKLETGWAGIRCLEETNTTNVFFLKRKFL
jgi:hypothetical protein